MRTRINGAANLSARTRPNRGASANLAMRGSPEIFQPNRAKSRMRDQFWRFPTTSRLKVNELLNKEIEVLTVQQEINTQARATSR
jgi:hypothetical protein